MKYKISVIREIEMEIESEALEKIAKDPLNETCNPSFGGWIDEATGDVEKATGISCGCFDATETIDAIYTADNHIALLEW